MQKRMGMAGCQQNFIYKNRWQAGFDLEGGSLPNPGPHYHLDGPGMDAAIQQGDWFTTPRDCYTIECRNIIKIRFRSPLKGTEVSS